MTDTLSDLLHESVADVEMPDLADAAWNAGTRARHRRTTAVVVGAAAASLVVAGSVWALGHQSNRPAVGPVHRPSPTATPLPDTGSRPDGDYRGTSLWWAPSVGQERALAYTASPLPTTIDLSVPVTPLVGDPMRRALAAFAVSTGDGTVDGVDVLGDDGVLRLVSLGPRIGASAPVTPMRDPEGNLRIRAGASMLSPSGEYLMFPQDGSIRLLRLVDSQWSTIDTGTRATWDATWADDSADRIVLWDPSRPNAHPPVYDVDGRAVSRAGATDALNPRWDSDPYGLPRRSLNGSLAQSFTAGADVRQPPALHLSPGQSDWIGVASAPDAILVLPQEAARQKQCCQVAGWLDGGVLLYESRSSQGLRLLAWQQATGNFWQVSQVVGWTMGEESVVSSYARFPVAEVGF